MTKRDMMEALDGLDDDAEIRVEVELRVFDYPYTERVADLQVQNVFTSEQLVILHGEIG